MEISAAALPFLILAAALGPPTHGAPADGFQPREFGVNEHAPVALLAFVGGGAPRHPADCCPKYTSQNIQCGNMESYYVTSSGCFLPAVMFKTKRGKKLCADPFLVEVQDCVMKLAEANTPGTSLV